MKEATLSHLYGQTDHLIHLVTGLHQLPLAESGQLRLDKKFFYFAGMVKEAITVFEPLLEEKGITPRKDIDQKIIAAMGDESRLRQGCITCWPTHCATHLPG